MKEVTLERNRMNVKNVGNPLVIPVPSEGTKKLTVKVLLNVSSIGKTSFNPHLHMWVGVDINMSNMKKLDGN